MKDLTIGQCAKFFDLPLLSSNDDVLVVHSSLCTTSTPIAQLDYSEF